MIPNNQKFKLVLLLFIVAFVFGENIMADTIRNKKLGEDCTIGSVKGINITATDPRGNCEVGYCISGKCQLGIKSSVGVGDFKKGEVKAISGSTIGEFINEIYKYALGVVGILATVVMMIGGFIWITAGGNAGRVSDAKNWIFGAITGLVLTMCSWLILNTINPDLVVFKPINPKDIKAITPGCCEWNDDPNDPPPMMVTKDYCYNGTDTRGTFYAGDYYYPGEHECKKYSTNGKPCDEYTKCKPGLDCISINIIAAQAKQICTDHRLGSPCHISYPNACLNTSCDNPKCKNNKCICED